MSDDIGKDLEQAEELKATTAERVALEKRILELRKDQKEVSQSDYDLIQEDLKVREKQAAIEQERERILQSIREGNVADTKNAEKRLATLEKENEALKDNLKTQKAIADQADNLFKRTFGFMYSETPETSIGSFFANPAAFSKRMLANMGKLADASKVLTGITDTIVQQSFALAIAQDQAVVSFRTATGATGAFDDNIRGLERSLFTAGVSSMEASNAVRSLFSNVSDFTVMSEAQQEVLGETVAVLNELGVSVENSAKNIQFATKVLGMSTTQATELQRELFTFAQNLGVSVDQISSDFASMGPQIAALGAGGVDAFRNLEVQAKNTGLQINEILGLVEKFDRFDTAAQSVGKLNALLGGPYLNTLELVAETDPSKRFEILKDRIDDAGLSFDTMDYYQRRALASAVGLNEQQLALMMRGSLDLIQEPQKSAAEIEALAAQTAQFNTITQEFAQTLQMLAISFGPTISFFKGVLQLVQKLAPLIQALAAGFLAYRTALVAVNTVMAIHSALTFEVALGEAAVGTAAGAAAGPVTIFGFSLGLTTVQLVAAGAALFAFGYLLYHSMGSPSFIEVMGIAALAVLGFAVAMNVFGFSMAPVIPILLALGGAVTLIGLGIGAASAGMSLFVNSLNTLSTGIASSMTQTALAVQDIVESINELDTVKTVAIGAAMVPLATAAPAAALASAAVGAVTRGVGAAEAASPAAASVGGPPPVINVQLSIDGEEFATVVNNVSVENKVGSNAMYSTIVDMIHKGFTVGV